MNDPQNSTHIMELLTVLRRREQKFQKERQEVRADYLVRGICEKEVDGLLEDPSLFPDTWLPLHLRWHVLCQTEKNLHGVLVEAERLLYGMVSEEIDYSTAKAVMAKMAMDE